VLVAAISSAPEVTAEVAVEGAGVEVTEADEAADAAAAIGHRLIGLVGSVATGMCLVAEFCDSALLP